MNLNFQDIKKVRFFQSHRSFIEIQTGDGRMTVQSDNDQYSTVYAAIVAEANKRGMFAERKEVGYSGREYTYYFASQAKANLSNSQSLALRDLLQWEVIAKLDGEKHRRWTNDQIHFKTRESLMKLGYIAHTKTGDSNIISINMYEADYMVLTDLGRAKAQELYPDITVEELKSERQTERKIAQRRVEIKRDIRKHFSKQLDLSEVHDNLTIEVHRTTGKIEDLRFHFATSVAVGALTPPKVTVRFVSNAYKQTSGWTVSIVSKHASSVNTTYGLQAIEIDPMYLAEFVEMIGKAQQLITRITTEPLLAFTGAIE